VVPQIFFPGILMPGIFFVGMYAYPFIERRLTSDRASHELLDRPRFHPVRTAIGTAVLTYFVVLTVAGSQDVIAVKLRISVQAVAWALRIGVLVLPVLVGVVTWAWCRGLARGSQPDEEGDDERPTGGDTDELLAHDNELERAADRAFDVAARVVAAGALVAGLVRAPRRAARRANGAPRKGGAPGASAKGRAPGRPRAGAGPKS
jgi:ubiquinol-cytochrome c reductase cytochrome b subunit